MKQFFLFVFLAFAVISANAQLLSWSPAFIKETDSNIEIIADATKGSKGLENYTPTTDVYVHIGVITNLSTGPSNWKYVLNSNFNTPYANAQCTYLGSNKWKYTIPSNLRTFFGISNPAEHIVKIAILFRSGNGTKKLANTDGSDMYIPVYSDGLTARLDKPSRQPKFIPEPETITASAGDAIPVSGVSSQTAKLRILFNGSPKDSVAAGTSINTTVNAVSGDNQIVLEASNTNGTSYDTIKFFVNTPVTVLPLPAGVRDGINYLPGDTSVTLVLYAPDKTRAAVIGDFNGWTQTASYQMNRTPDGIKYWITLNGLNPGTEYAFQYLIDGNIRVADIYSEKVLDPWNDQYIPAANYPSLKPYPAGQSGIVGVLQTAKPAYNWQTTTYNRPDKKNLIIYELLVRDFVSAQNWQTLKDTLSYLKKLGVNAIELMPFNEFEGNNSWGYNPDFYFAPDKMYGTENALKQFIDACHANGIAVIMDIAMNHAFGLSPTVQMYWNAAAGKPAANNPWHNADAKHPFNVGFDFNHESDATKYLVNRVVNHWLTNYKIDGFRWDLSKGFTQKQSSDVVAWSAYDAGRINTWKRIYDTMQNVSSGSYCILEHFANNDEETALANYGMLLWGNMNYNFSEAAMGYVNNSDLSWGISTARGWNNPHLITYAESHDEERMMYRLLNFGNNSGGYNTKSFSTAVKRLEMSAAFLTMAPGPKMLWQFGELAYDKSINLCENGTIHSDCRTAPKPVLWNYKNDPVRSNLYNVYSKLLALRNHTPYLPAFITNNISYNLNGAFKWMKVSSAALNIVVIGNFDVVPVTGNVSFQSPGIWYSYLTGTTFTATGSNQSFTLQPGEFYVYLDKDANAALPLDLIAFDAYRTNASVELKWSTANEINVSHFEAERSFNGNDFVMAGSVSAQNTHQLAHYQFIDKNEMAANAANTVYYRIKMVDKDGKFSYSSTKKLLAYGRDKVEVYPNPVNGSLFHIQLPVVNNETLQVKLTDVSGRTVHLSSNQAQQQRLSINVQQLPAGTYYLTVEGRNFKASQPIMILK